MLNRQECRQKRNHLPMILENLRLNKQTVLPRSIYMAMKCYTFDSWLHRKAIDKGANLDVFTKSLFSYSSLRERRSVGRSPAPQLSSWMCVQLREYAPEYFHMAANNSGRRIGIIDINQLGCGLREDQISERINCSIEVREDLRHERLIGQMLLRTCLLVLFRLGIPGALQFVDARRGHKLLPIDTHVCLLAVQ